MAKISPKDQSYAHTAQEAKKIKLTGKENINIFMGFSHLRLTEEDNTSSCITNLTVKIRKCFNVNFFLPLEPSRTESRANMPSSVVPSSTSSPPDDVTSNSDVTTAPSRLEACLLSGDSTVPASISGYHGNTTCGLDIKRCQHVNFTFTDRPVVPSGPDPAGSTSSHQDLTLPAVRHHTRT
ncbi:hypothetical protein ACOMHN_007161 [Nucella lapillus]